MKPFGLHGRTAAISMLWCVVSILTAFTPAAGPESWAETCPIAAEQGGIKLPVDRLSIDTRCLLEPIVNRATTSGQIGPIPMPIQQALYEYLLDRPVITASMVERFGLGAYQFSMKGPNQFWGNDGEGTQGLVTLVYHDHTNRIYHIDGYHEGQIFPLVRATAAVFVRIVPQSGPEGHPVVETSLLAYTKLNDPMLSALVHLLKPLIGEAVTRKLTKAFDVTNQLGLQIAKDPARIIQELPSLSKIGPDDQRVLLSLLQTLARQTSGETP